MVLARSMLFVPRKLLGIHLPSWLVPALGYAISIGSLIWAFHGVDFRALIKDYASIVWAWVPLAVIADLSVYVWQSVRWNLLLAPVKRVSRWRSVQAIYVGLFANEILPMRPGEVIRAYLLGRWSDARFSVVLSSVIIERIFDGIWLMLAFFVATLVVPMPRFLVEGGKLTAVFVAVVAVLLAIVMFRKHHAHAVVSTTRWATTLRGLVEDLHLMGRSRAFYASFLASLPYLLLQVLPIYFLMRAYTLDLSFWAATVVLLIVRLGTILPQAPGNVGVLQILTELALKLFGVDKTTAAGFSAIVWIVITAPLLAAGSVALIVTGMRFAELRRHAETLSPVPAGDPQAR